MPKRIDFSAMEAGAADGARDSGLSPEVLANAQKEELVLAKQNQKRVQSHEIHGIRKRHAWLLFMLASLWIYVLWLVVLLQGFGQWFISLPWFVQLNFKLSDPVMIAFMTSTTATVLGLYGIAAYWLYGNGNGKNKNGKK